MPLPPAHFISDRAPVARQKGFALLITITLLAFLVLLLVSLASLTRVETQVASNSQQLAQARQNALMALNVALGNLQKQAGPDQRVTAKADVLTSYNGSPTASSVSSTFDTFWQTRNRGWTGIWGNNAAQIGYTLKPSQITGSGTSRELLGWLVSGNESSSFTLGASGQTTNASTPKFTPDLQVSGLSSSIDPLTTSLTFPVANAAAGTSTTRGILLVGPASASDGTTAGKTASFNAGNFVAAPIVDIQAPASTIPGMGTASTATTVGGYAYWVGDEGVKARGNLRDSYQRQTASADQTAYQLYSFITSQRSAVELMNYDTTNPLGSDYIFNSSSLDRLQSVSQLSYIGSSAAQPRLRSASTNRFHDLTTYSQGVLADTYAGGLKKDLTADIADVTSSTSATRPGDSDPLFTTENATDTVPTWGMLRAFPRTNPSSGGLTPTPATATSPGVYPVISHSALGLDFILDTGNNLQVALFPCVTLWNPYATTLKATTYEFGFRTQAGGQLLLQTRAPSGVFATVATLDFSTGQMMTGTSSGGGGGFIRFQIQCPDIPPGEHHIFALGTTGAVYSGANLMTRVPASGATGISNCVLIQAPVAVNVATDNFRAIINQVGSTGTIDSLNVALAKPGGLATTTNTANWYQAVVDARPGRLGTISAGAIIFKADTPLASMPTSSSGATAALRVTAVMEARGSWNNANANIGALGAGRNHWLLLGNIRAPLIRNTSVENNGSSRGNILYGAVINMPDYNPGRDIVLPFLNYRYQYRLGIGGTQEITNTATYTPAIMFDVLPSKDLFLSLGQLQNAQLAPYGFYATYPFGNSWADVRIPRGSQYMSNVVSPNLASGYTQNLYDLSWHLNRALWDKYFVSGVPSTWTASDISSERPLPNGRFGYIRHNGAPPALSDLQFSGSTNNAYNRASANLFVKGAFNVNSTSEQAWRALLAGTYQLPQNPTYADAGDNISALGPVPRISGKPNAIAASYSGTAANTMTTAANYFGNRGLLLTNATTQPLPAIVNELARTIVVEVRTRGPFLSLADFINRRVGAGDPGIKGSLQSAMESMTPSTTNNGTEVNPFVWANSALLNSGEKPVGAWNTEHFLGGPLSAVGTNKDGFRTRFVAAPKYLTQADLLSLLGPALSARSDTFRIRTYGEVKNPVTGDITGRAWCEAIVQRLPDYVDSTDTAETAPSALTAANNRTFGRRFTVTSFRWLSPSDL